MGVSLTYVAEINTSRKVDIKRMRPLALLTLVILILFYLSCSNDFPAVGTVDSLITEQEAQVQNFDSMTPEFNMQVAIRSDVSGNTGDILNSLDQDAATFLQCQFGNSQVGLQDFQIQSGEVVPPLSMLRVFVVPFTFHCQAIGTDTCSGVFFPDSDLIIISEQSLGRCGEFPLFRHELGHRYGMAPDHSNISEFQSCITPSGCFFNDLENLGNLG